MTSSQIPSRIAMPCPFGGFGTTNITPIQTATGSDVNFPDGFPSVYGAPTGNNGKFVTRKEMNAIGNLASNDLFYHKCGGLNTFDAEFCAQIGGYPAGAVLDYINGSQISKVMSLIDNNTFNFIDNGIDGINWMLCNQDRPSAFIFSDNSITTSSGFTTLGTFVANRSGVISTNFDYTLSRHSDYHQRITRNGNIFGIVSYPKDSPCVLILDASTSSASIKFPSVSFTGTSPYIVWAANGWVVASGALLASILRKDAGATPGVWDKYLETELPTITAGHKYIVGLATPYEVIEQYTYDTSASATGTVDKYTLDMTSSVEINIV